MSISDLKIPYIAVIALSFIALFPLPYGYYTFLKIVVTICSGLTAYIYFKEGSRSILVWLCVAVAIISNPIIKVSLDKELWMIINSLVAGLFVYLLYNVLKRGKNNK